MKKLLLIILILLPCNLWAQEGCGKWVTTKHDVSEILMLTNPPSALYIYSFPFPLGDSVWVPKPCPDMLWGVDITGIRDSVRQRQMTIEEKVDLLFDMVQSLTAEIEYWRVGVKRLWIDEDTASAEYQLQNRRIWNPETKKWEKIKK